MLLPEGRCWSSEGWLSLGSTVPPLDQLEETGVITLFSGHTPGAVNRKESAPVAAGPPSYSPDPRRIKIREEVFVPLHTQ
jgi:hypothetical protein